MKIQTHLLMPAGTYAWLQIARAPARKQVVFADYLSKYP